MNRFPSSPDWRTRVGLLAAFVFLTGWEIMEVPQRTYGASQGEQVIANLGGKLRWRFTNPQDPKGAEVKIIPYEDPKNSAKGRFKTIILRSTPAAIKKMPVESIDMRADDVTIDVTRLFKNDEIATVKCAKTRLEAVVSEDNLNTLFARGKSTKDMHLKASFVDGKVRITGQWKLFMFKGPIETVGKLALTKDNNLNFDMESLKMNNAEAPDSVKKQFMSRINPVVEFSDLPFQPKVSTITFRGHKVHVST